MATEQLAAYCLGCATRLRGPEEQCPHCGLSRAPSVAELAAPMAAVPSAEYDATVTPVAWPPRMSDGIVVEGGYRIERFLARGGMGEVYEGLDTRLHRRVAIKFLADEFRSDRVLVQRFLREARAVASLDHPNIVAVHAVGEHDGRPLMVMKFVDGQTVAELVHDRGRLPIAEAAEIVLQVCDGLQHIHARGFIHRDIKPQNLMLDRDGRALILDFGILRGVSSTATATGMVFGTPAYMPPEQAKDAKLVDGRSDLYALGVTFFEMLTGRLPFRGTSSLELLMKHQLEDPPAMGELVGDIPPALERIVRRALEKDPQKRFDSAAQMRDALREFLREAPHAMAGELPLAPRPPRPAAPLAAAAAQSAERFVPGSTTAIRGESLRLEAVSPDTEKPPRRGLSRGGRIGLLLGGAAVLVLIGVLVFPRQGDNERSSLATGRSASAGPAVGSGVAPAPLAAPATGAAPAANAVTVAPAAPAAPAAVAVGNVGRATLPATILKADSSAQRDESETAEESPRARRKAARLVARTSESPAAEPRAEPARAPEPVRAPEPARAPEAYRATTPEVKVAPVPAVAKTSEGTLRVVTMFEGKGLWARVLVDGRETGNRTHVWSDKLTPGSYVVSARREGYTAKEQRVQVRAGETARLRLELEKN